MTDALREKMMALKSVGKADFSAHGRSIAIRNDTVDDVIALLDEHCARQRERFEKAFPPKKYEGLQFAHYCDMRNAWNAAIATITETDKGV